MKRCIQQPKAAPPDTIFERKMNKNASAVKALTQTPLSELAAIHRSLFGLIRVALHHKGRSRTPLWNSLATGMHTATKHTLTAKHT